MSTEPIDSVVSLGVIDLGIIVVPLSRRDHPTPTTFATRITIVMTESFISQADRSHLRSLRQLRCT